MSDAFWVNLAANLTALAVLLGVLFRFRQENRKAIAENTEITKNAQNAATKAEAAVTNGLTAAVEEVHQATNSMKDELIRATAAMEYAKGILAGRAQILEEQLAESKKKP